MPNLSHVFGHSRISRRAAMQAGGCGVLGLGVSSLPSLAATSSPADRSVGEAPAKTCIYIFLTGGLGQLDSFDLKPAAPADVRGEFSPIATNTSGIQICEHLPMLAQRSHLWALCRSLTHPSNEHSAGHHIMLTGRTMLPPGFNSSQPSPSDWPSIASIAGRVTRPRNNLPPAVILPEKLVHYSGRVIPGPFAGVMGPHHTPWFIEASPFHSTSYGAYPEYKFDHQQREGVDDRVFQAPNMTFPQGLSRHRLHARLDLLGKLGQPSRQLDRAASIADYDRFRQGVIKLLTDSRVHRALDVTRAEDRVQERYGRNAFGWSLLMARRLVEIGVNFVQVNLGNDETWDTHGNAFPHLKEKLLPPTDRALSALLDDLSENGMLDDTLIVMAGEFGRTPKISLLPRHYKLPGRDHWGAVQSVLFAGGGVKGGQVIGASDKDGGFPADIPQKPESMAATIYRSLGIPSNAQWYDSVDRPHPVYHGDPIPGLI